MAPEEPEMPPIVREVLRLRAAGLPVPRLARDAITAYHHFQAQVKEYEADLAEHEAFLQSQDLDWDTFFNPVPYFPSTNVFGSPIDVRSACSFQGLRSLSLLGCTISDNLVQPSSGFPGMTKLSVFKCKWGEGLWSFLAATPKLEHLDIRDLSWNRPPLHHEGSADDDRGSMASSSPASTSAQRTEEEPSRDDETSRSPSTGHFDDEETPPYTGPSTPPAEVSQVNYILENSFVTVLGDDTHPIYDFDEDSEDEDLVSAREELIESISNWCKAEPVYTYPELICYPHRIDAGSSWTVITKPIYRRYWKYELGLRFQHRVYTHFEDESFQGDDFASAYDWQDLQCRRAAVRKAFDSDITSETSDEGTSPSSYRSDARLWGRQQGTLTSRANGLHAPPHIDLIRLKTFHFSGGQYPPIWANPKSRNGSQALRPALYMPNLDDISLSGSRSLRSTELARPLASIHKYALGLVTRDATAKIWQPRVQRITAEEWEEILCEFEEGAHAVLSEPTDKELLDMLPADEADYYKQRPWKMPDARHNWRLDEGLLDRESVTDENALLAMITGASYKRPVHFAATALIAGSPNLTKLDLSYSNVSPEVFRCLLRYAGQLRELFLAGVIDLHNSDLQAIPCACSLLTSLDISNCGSNMTAKGAAFVVDRIKQHPQYEHRNMKIKVDDPSTAGWLAHSLANRTLEYTYYQYLEFIGVLVDEELELWLECQRNGKAFSKLPGKQRQSLKHPELQHLSYS